MVQSLISLLPTHASAQVLMLCIASAIAGAAVWLAGGRFGRSIITLCAVASGTWIGLQLPRWMGWGIDEMATAICGALVLGVAGFVLHRFWIAAGLGLFLAAWGAAVVFFLRGGMTSHWSWPAATTVPQYLLAIWKKLPDDARLFLPPVCGTAMLSGLVAYRVWPRPATAVMWSLVGLTLLVGWGMASIRFAHPATLRALPTDYRIEAAVLTGMLAIGVVAQWQLMPAPPPKPAKKKPDGD